MMRTRLLVGVLLCLGLSPHAVLRAQEALPTHQLVIYADQGQVQISRHIYGHFIEHLGYGIYGGFWQRDAQGRWHLRQDIIEALRHIRIPNLRWPGGCFADLYHWKDGIGPREQRPPILNAFWGQVVEDNSFGTHEFMELIEALGAEPYIAGNVGSGTPREMAEWVEYLTAEDGPMARLRKQNGREKPWRVPFWGVGNESWGCGGHMDPEHYADLYRRFATYLFNYSGNQLYKVAAGPADADTTWTSVLMRHVFRRYPWLMQGISVHYYTWISKTGNWNDKEPAVGFDEWGWFQGLKKGLFLDNVLRGHKAVMDRYDPEKRVGLVVDEWGMWHAPEPGSNPAFLVQQNTLRDALVAAVSLNIFNHHADRVKMANLAQTINVLQALILTREGEDTIVRTPTYHVFDLYKEHQDATLVPIALEAGEYRYGNEAIPALNASASRNAEGAVHLTIANLDPHQERVVHCRLEGARPARVAGRVLTADAMDAHNTFEAPNRVQPTAFTGYRQLGNGVYELRLPAKSVVALTFYSN